MIAGKILVVDDEPDIRSLIKEILEDETFEVAVAEDATEANNIRESFDPDLILLDIWMPDIDGISLLKQWNESDQMDVPVIMISGHGTVETAVEATRLGAYDFIEKPLSLAKLILTVNHALEKTVKLVGAVSCLLYIRYYEAISAPSIIYLQVALLAYFVVINRLVVYIICNRLSKVARSENT